MTYAEIDVELIKLLHLLLRQSELSDLQVAQEAVMVVTLGNNSQALLNSPSEQYLSGA